ncbi:MAG: ion channel [Bryobacteraceae bacterium]|jgi:inward rectifier potassium channel
MQKPDFDPGLTRQFGAPLRRAVNKDGTFNVRRSGVDWRAYHPWIHLVSMSWPAFSVVVGLTFLGINSAFALAYFLMGPSAVLGAAAPDEFGRFLNDFFFSGQTLTTVGYGTLAPRSILASLTATSEGAIGLLSFAVITGLLVARVSRPSARIRYSRNALIAPYQNASALMFRIANERSNILMEMDANVLLMTVINPAGTPERKFDILPLERPSVLLFPLTWTIVHPIDETSPLFGKTAADLAQLQVELIVLVRGFDDTFSQVVHSRFSYRHDEIVWGAKFLPAFKVEASGDLLLEIDKVGEFGRI